MIKLRPKDRFTLIIRRGGAVLACLCWGTACASPCSRDTGQAPLPATQLVLETSAGRQAISAEVADSARERSRGLMCRRVLAADAGMLFVYPQDTPARMWMKDTLLPLDLLFVTSEGRIVSIVEHAQPLSENWIEAQQPVRYVLELKAGSARRLQLEAGDRLLLQ